MALICLEKAHGAFDSQFYIQQLSERMERVPEFRYIRSEANNLGLKVYLFGGTASAYAHYVKWDLMRESRHADLQADRFDYDFLNIYRANQDLDLVVDGPAELIDELQDKLQTQYPHFQGSKQAWELRSLREDVGDKISLLKNPDFLNQHSDSNSTGLIEVTSKDPFILRDLFDWDNPSSQYLEDILEGKLRYYFSDLHDTTSRFQQGKNPPILSVIRYLIKAVQFQLQLRDEDLDRIRHLIDKTDTDKNNWSTYVHKWIEANGVKLFRHAVDMEYAWNLLEDLGLRERLINLSGNVEKENSLAWWMNKEPLRSDEVGKGNGKTAQQLSVEIVAHETSGFQAWESITKSHWGYPNVFSSRKGFVGELAAYGDGFYTRTGKQGAMGTGWTIRFVVDPQAREGSDFKLHGDYLIFRNKKAFKVMHEPIRLGLPEYIEYMLSLKGSENDKGMIEKLKRRLDQKKYSIQLTKTDKKRISKSLGKLITKTKGRYGFSEPSENSALLLANILNTITQVDSEFSHTLMKRHEKALLKIYHKDYQREGFLRRHKAEKSPLLIKAVRSGHEDFAMAFIELFFNNCAVGRQAKRSILCIGLENRRSVFEAAVSGDKLKLVKYLLSFRDWGSISSDAYTSAIRNQDKNIFKLLTDSYPLSGKIVNYNRHRLDQMLTDAIDSNHRYAFDAILPFIDFENLGSREWERLIDASTKSTNLYYFNSLIKYKPFQLELKVKPYRVASSIYKTSPKLVLQLIQSRQIDFNLKKNADSLESYQRIFRIAIANDDYDLFKALIDHPEVTIWQRFRGGEHGYSLIEALEMHNRAEFLAASENKKKMYHLIIKLAGSQPLERIGNRIMPIDVSYYVGDKQRFLEFLPLSNGYLMSVEGQHLIEKMGVKPEGLWYLRKILQQPLKGSQFSRNLSFALVAALKYKNLTVAKLLLSDSRIDLGVGASMERYIRLAEETKNQKILEMLKARLLKDCQTLLKSSS